MTEAYEPPKVWTWNKESGGRFAAINRPIAGPTQDKELPVGKHPLQLYSLGTPNGVKVTVMLEELLAAGHSGAEYDAWLINIGSGDQFGSDYVAANPNSKIPVLVDRSGAKPQRVFESGAILLYLAEKFGAFLPKDPAKRTEALSWLFWQMGSAPFLEFFSVYPIPDHEGLVNVPAWGLGTVIASANADIAVGERFRGFLHLTNVVQMKARKTTDGFVACDAHRSKLVKAYNVFVKVERSASSPCFGDDDKADLAMASAPGALSGLTCSPAL